ncbi:Acetyl esterase [compost metagenome]
MSMLAETHDLIQLSASAGRPHISELSAADARERFEESAALLDLPPVPLAVVENLQVPGPAGAVPVRLYTPTADCAGPVVMYMHGGGWVIGSLDTHDSFCRYLSQRLGMRVMAVHYRRAPEHPFPAAVDDCLACLEWLLGSPTELGAPVEAVGLAGDSCGGNLSAVLSQMADGRVRAQLVIYPVTDVSRYAASYDEFAVGYLMERADMDYFINNYVPNVADRSDPRVSPLLAERILHPTPSVMLTAGLDVLRDEGRAYAARLVGEGVPLKFHEAVGLPHGMINLRAVLPSGVPILDRCIDDLKSYLI